MVVDLSSGFESLFLFYLLALDIQAKFKITLDVPSELIALSNMPVVEEKLDGHLKTVSFQESPIMSTYLVAVVIGLFDYVEGHTTDGTIADTYLCRMKCSSPNS